MMFQFIHAAWLPLLLLGLGPLVAHWLSRARPPAVSFSSIMFIRRIVRHTRRMKRPQDWLLLVLRTLLVLAAVSMFLRPLFFGDQDLAARGVRRSVVVVVDASASMGYVEDAQSRFAAACAEASDILAGLAPGDRANLVWLRSSPEAVLPELGVNHRRLRDALRRGEVSRGSGNIEGALRLAVDMLADAEGRKGIFIVSDFQATAWRGVVPRAPEGVALATVQPEVSEGDNTAVLGLHTEPALPLAGEPARLFARIGNYAARPRSLTVYFEAGEKRDRQELTIPAWGEATAVMPFVADQAGWLPLSASVSEDRFAVDNRRETVVEVKPFLRVGLLGGDVATLDGWTRIVAALPWARGERVAWESAASDRWDALLVAGWNGEAAEALREARRRGIAVVVEPAVDSAVSGLSALTDAPRATAEPTLTWLADVPRETMQLEIARTEDALFGVFSGGEFGAPGAGRFRRRLRPGRGVAWGGGEALLRYPDGVPALARLEGGGHLYLWNLAVDPTASTWAAQPEAVVLLGELLRNARAADGGAVRHFVIGERPVSTFDVDVLASELVLESTQGVGLPVSRGERAGDGRTYMAEHAREAGVYTWMLGEQALACSVVSLPARESDLRTLSTEAMTQSGARPLASGRQVRDLQEGLPLWPALLGIGLAVMVAEGMAAWWAGRA